MEKESINIEYRKFSSFLKDYIKTLRDGHLFLASEETHSVGEVFDFSIKVHGLEEILKAEGKVVSAGCNDAGMKGIRLDFRFDSATGEYLSSKLPGIVLEKYGNVWGGKLDSLMTEKNRNA